MKAAVNPYCKVLRKVPRIDATKYRKAYRIFSDEEYPVLERQPPCYNPLNTFTLAKGDQKHYRQQYGDMYFLRLAKIKPIVEALADEEWKAFEVCNKSLPRQYWKEP